MCITFIDWPTTSCGAPGLPVLAGVQPFDANRRAGLADEQSTHCVLPTTPLSYQGQLISLQWGVRVRIFLADGREIVAEQPFHLVSRNS